MKEIKNFPLSLWNEVALESKTATFFHTPTWAKIITNVFPCYRIISKGYDLGGGDIAVFPIVATIERNGFFLWTESMYLGTYGGLIANRELSDQEVHEILKSFLCNKRIAHLHLIGNPFSKYSYSKILSEEPLFTHILSLGEFHEVRKRFSDDKQRGMKKATQFGIEISIADTEEEYQAYYQVYEDTIRRWGKTTLVRYPYTLFEQLWLHKSESIKLWLAKMDDEVVSGKIIFYHNRYAFYWHGATLEKYFRFYPDPKLMATIIEDACEKGYQFLDMGPSGGLKGVEKYKEKFGAQVVPFYSYTWQSNKIYNLYQKVKSFV